MAIRIDFHAHIFPDLRLFAGPLAPFLPDARIDQVRSTIRQVLKPISFTLHRTQTFLRLLPDPVRKYLDQLSGLAPLASLLFESTAQDLGKALDQSGIDHAVVIAHPPLCPNEHVLEACENDSRLIAAVNIPPGTKHPKIRLKRYVERGAKILKIHPALDGLTPESPHYLSLIEAATEMGLPIIIHTGCIHSHSLFKSPEMGEVELFKPWFEEYTKARFVLAHMNYHLPGRALDLGEKYTNLWVDTSWQPAEIIGEAARRLGPERVLFGTDWPIIGNNLEVGLSRIQDEVIAGTLKPEEADLILGINAAKLLGIPCP